jgi:EAL and modified HD-GYP domain-containing signal transduction protein
MAAARGRLLELLAERRSSDTRFADRAFMTGVLSLLDTLFEMPMAEALSQMSLPDDVTAALRERTGILGRMLDIACALEDADDLRVATLLADGDPCSTAELAQLQIAALAWSNALGQLQR